MKRKGTCILILLIMGSLGLPLSAQNLFRRIDNALSTRYYKTDNIDTAYVARPSMKWTLRIRANVSGTTIETEGKENGQHFKSKLEAERKTTLSVGVSYLGLSLSASINPAQLLGKYRDNEFYFTLYGKSFGCDFTYQDAKNFTGWHEQDGIGRINLPEDVLSVKTFNANAYYIFNHRRFSYPAAFTQSYIQRRSAGSFMLAASVQAQHAFLDWDEDTDLKMTNIAIGAGYGYNFVPGRGWLLHISALPTFIVYSKTSVTLGDVPVPLNYHFPEVIITGRGAVVRQTSRTFYGLNMNYNFTNIGQEKSLAVHNVRWMVRTFFGFRL